MSERLKSTLCEDALTMAIRNRRPPRGLIHHSDCGVQYACSDDRKLLRLHGINTSMSCRGNCSCLDNAPMESFFSSLKTELVHRTRFATRRESQSCALRVHRDLLQSPTTPLEHRLPDTRTSKDGHHCGKGRIDQQRPGPGSGSNVKIGIVNPALRWREIVCFFPIEVHMT